MKPVKPAGVLREGSPPGHRHGEEEGVQALVVKTFPKVAPGRHDHPLVLRRDRRQAVYRLAPLPLALPAAQNDDVLCEAGQPIRQRLRVIRPFGHHDR